MVRFAPDEGSAELVSSLLWDAGTTGIVESDGAILAGFDDRDSAEAVAERAANWPVTVVAVEPSDWAGTEEITTVTVGPDEPWSPERQRTLSIVAGQTFGHGGHPTTALALDLLAEAVPARIAVGSTPSVLDVGTGSGVLAIAAATLGAGPVVGLDIDQDAVARARANAERNGVQPIMTDRSVTEAGALIDDRAFDIVVANVLLPVHRELASAMASLLAGGAALITTGYLEADDTEVIDLHRGAIEGAGAGQATIGAERKLDGWLAHRFDLRGAR